MYLIKIYTQFHGTHFIILGSTITHLCGFILAMSAYVNGSNDNVHTSYNMAARQDGDITDGQNQNRDKNCEVDLKGHLIESMWKEDIEKRLDHNSKLMHQLMKIKQN